MFHLYESIFPESREEKLYCLHEKKWVSAQKKVGDYFGRPILEPIRGISWRFLEENCITHFKFIFRIVDPDWKNLPRLLEGLVHLGIMGMRLRSLTLHTIVLRC